MLPPYLENYFGADEKLRFNDYKAFDHIRLLVWASVKRFKPGTAGWEVPDLFITLVNTPGKIIGQRKDLSQEEVTKMQADASYTF